MSIDLNSWKLTLDVEDPEDTRKPLEILPPALLKFLHPHFIKNEASMFKTPAFVPNLNVLAAVDVAYIKLEFVVNNEFPTSRVVAAARVKVISAALMSEIFPPLVISTF